jgi:hypothetical protein
MGSLDHVCSRHLLINANLDEHIRCVYFRSDSAAGPQVAPVGGRRPSSSTASSPAEVLKRFRRQVAAGGCVIKHMTRTARGEALIVRGMGHDVDHLDQPGASLSLSADVHLNVLDNSDDRMYP